jgi:Protein kinase domain
MASDPPAVNHHHPQSKRPVLSERQPKAAPIQSPVDLLTTTAPKMPHHESLEPAGNLSSGQQQQQQEQQENQKTQQPASPKLATPAPAATATAAANKRISAIVNDAPPNPNRNSAISTASTASGKSRRKTHVGPWQLGRTLGKGATGRVRLAKHAMTGQVAAVKIVSKKSASMAQSASMLQMTKVSKEDPNMPSSAGFRMMPFNIEREVVIMKLIAHPNIVNLYDVWENRGELSVVCSCQYEMCAYLCN